MGRHSYQIFLGGAKGRGYSMEEIAGRIPNPDSVGALIVGWTEEEQLYRQLREYAKHYGMELWLWFPVFSEHSMQAFFRPQYDIETKQSMGSAVFDGDEIFDFCCPSDASLVGKLTDIYDRFYQNIGFDGVFLDRIRYPSFTMGLPAVFGCRCGECAAWFEEKGLSDEDINGYYQRLKRRIADPACINPLEISCYFRGSYRFDNPFMERFLEGKQQRIAETVSHLVRVFRERNLKIGMDFFAPLLAPWVGQDYKKLGEMADMVKPMLYRLTDTPAGMGYELEAIYRAICCGREETDRKRKEFLKDLYGISADETKKELFHRELQTIRGFGESLSGARFVPGIELHTVEEKPAVSLQELKENIRILEAEGFQERIACWDLMSTDAAHRDVFVRGNEV